MKTGAACPESRELVSYSLGMTADRAADLVAAHLQECSRCVAALHTLRVEDTLIDAMRAQTVLLDRPVVDEQVRSVIGSVKLLYPAVERAAHEETLDFLEPPTEPGDLGLLGAYRILEVLGIGGMGIVFKAFDTKLRRHVALKVLRRFLAAQPGARERFLREARSAAALAHERLAPIFEVNDANGLPYLAMPLLEGETLEDRWKREHVLPPAEVAQIGRQIAEGLAAAHAHGLIHRDIKPANIWLESKDEGRRTKDEGDSSFILPPSSFQVKILDFGLARAAEDDSPLTQPGVLVGTPLYMAPEQADGKKVDARSDLFSLGSVLYSLCTGRAAFEAGSTMGVLRAVCDKDPPPVRSVNPKAPAALAETIERLLAKDPARRLQSADEAARQLRAVETMVADTRPRRRSMGALGLVAAALLVGCVGLGVAEVAGLTDVRSLVAPSKSSAVDPQTSIPQPTRKTDIRVVVVEPDETPKKQPAKVVEPERPTVYPAAILPFEERGAAVKDYGNKVMDLLFVHLAGKPNLQLVDRVELKKILQELELNASGAVNANGAAKVGQLTGAKVLVGGSVLAVDKDVYVSAKIVITETGRVLGESVKGKISDELGPLVEQLAEKLAKKLTTDAAKLVPKPAPVVDRLAALKVKLKGERPAVLVQVTERHIAGTAIDPAAQTEVTKFCKETGFTVIDPEEGLRANADVLITGEGISETLTRVGNLVSVKARLELKATDRKTGNVLFADRHTVIVVDLAEQMASKAAFQEAAAVLAEKMLPRLVTPEMVQLNVSRACSGR